MSASAQLSKVRVRLAACEAAIDQATTAAAVSTGGASISRQQLADLSNQRTRLLRELRALEGQIAGRTPLPGGAGVCRFPPPGLY